MEPRSGKIPTTSVRPRNSRVSRSLGLFDQIYRQTSRGNAGAGVVEVGMHGGQAGFDLVEEFVVLRVDGVGVDLVEHRVQHRLHPAPGVFGTHGHQVRGVVGAAPLPGGAGQVHADRACQIFCVSLGSCVPFVMVTVGSVV